MKQMISSIAFFLLISSLVILAPAAKAEAGWISGDEQILGVGKALQVNAKRVADGNPNLVKEFIVSRKLAEAKRQREYEILCRIVEAEATGGTIEQKRNVASCILARVGSSEFPNSIEEVVFQAKQFSPISDGRYYTVEITDSTREAVWLTIQEGCMHDCVWFCTPTCSSAKTGFHSTLDFQFFDGMHNYYH